MSFIALLSTFKTGLNYNHIIQETEWVIKIIILSISKLNNPIPNIVTIRRELRFIISTHSPFLLAYPDADIYVVSHAGFELIDYESTEQYRLMKYFVGNYQRFLLDLGFY